MPSSYFQSFVFLWDKFVWIYSLQPFSITHIRAISVIADSAMFREYLQTQGRRETSQPHVAGT